MAAAATCRARPVVKRSIAPHQAGAGRRRTPFYNRRHEREIRPRRGRNRRPCPLGAAAVGRPRRLPRDRKCPRQPGPSEAEVLRLLDAALPQRQAAHGPCAQLHHQRHARAPLAHEGHERADADGLGRLRPAGRKRGDEEQGAARAVDLRQHRPHEGPDASHGAGDRLVARGRHLHAAVLQVEPVAVPQDAGRRHRRAPHPGRQLGSGRPDRAGQ